MNTKNTNRPVKENYNKSGKMAKRREARRNQAIARQSSRLFDLREAQESAAKEGRYHANLDAAVKHAEQTLNNL